MNEHNLKKLTGGLTNITYLVKDDQNNLLVKQILQNDFCNHEIDYNILKKFNFVPKLIMQESKINYWQYIPNQQLQLNKRNLQKMATLLKKVHASDLEFPKNNIIKRINFYLSEINKKHSNKNLPVQIKKYFQLAIDVAKQLKQSTPVHNDPWIKNFLLSQSNKIYLIDWEYATMGDFHFDLAYFIYGSNLNFIQMKHFLKKYQSYDTLTLKKAAFLVNYLTILWIYKHDDFQNVFPHQKLFDFLDRFCFRLNNDLKNKVL